MSQPYSPTLLGNRRFVFQDLRHWNTVASVLVQVDLRYAALSFTMGNTPPRRNLRTQNLSPPCPSKRILFLERADSPLRQASASEQQARRSQQTSASHQRASASQQQDEELQSFHHFSELPPELQDQIWEHALDISAPTAHYIHVELESDGYWKVRALKVKSECDDCSSSRERPSIEAIYPVRQALMQTCRRSYAFVKDASKFWVRDSSGTPLLETGLSGRVWTECDCTPPSTRSTTPDLSDAQLSALLDPVYLEDLISRAGPPAPLKPLKRRVDTSHDLMISFHTVRNTFDTRTVYSDFERGMGTNAKQVAIPYHSSGLSHCRISLACMLGVLNELRTLYLLIDPRQVRSLPVPVNPIIRPGRPDPGYGYGEGNNPRHLELEEYLRKHRRTPEDTSPKIFHLRNRIYYELPDMAVLCMAFPQNVTMSFTTVEEVAKDQREKNGGVPLPPLVIRFMSWKLAPGVRGRFETDTELL